MNRKSLFKNSLAITIITVGNLGLAFLLQIVLAALFGAHADMDAYLASTTLPTLINTVLLGAFNFTLVPLLVELDATADTAAYWRTISHLVNVTGVVLGSLVIVGLFTAEPLVAVTNPGFTGQQLESTVQLFRLTWPSLCFVGVSNLLASVYYAKHRFILASLAPVVNAAIVLGAVLSLNRSWGVQAAAYGTLAGAIVQFVILLPILLTAGRYTPIIELHNPINRRAAVLMAPLLVGSLFYKATGLVERSIASSLGEGSIAVLGYAFKLAGAIQVVVAQGVVVSFLPSMSHSVAQRDYVELRRMVSLGLRGLLVITIPIVGLLIVLGHPLIEIFLQRGAFDQRATDATTPVFVAYLGWVLFSVVGGILTDAFYALQKTLTVVKVGVAGMLIYLFAAYSLTRFIGVLSLPLALSLTNGVNALVFIILLRRLLGGLEDKSIVLTLAKSLLAATLSTLLIAVLWQFSFNLELGGFPASIQLFAKLALAFIVGVGFYLVFASVLDLQELGTLTRYLRASPTRLWRAIQDQTVTLR